jgi:hypothetical protein
LLDGLAAFLDGAHPRDEGDPPVPIG